MPAPLYDALLILHVLTAVVGFGSLAIGGLVAAAGRRSSEPAGEERVVRFFREGVDWPARTVLLVPVLGLALLFGGDRSSESMPWPWLGLAVWFVALAILHLRTWPAEREAQRELAAIRAGEDAGGGRQEAFAAACGRMEAAATLTSICFVIAVALMIWQP
jgi:hypothetical protein